MAGEGAAIRLRIAGGEVRPSFVTEPMPDDEVVVVEGMRVFVSRGIVEQRDEVVIDATEEHGNLVVR